MSVKSFKFVSPGVFINEIDNSFIPKSANAIGPVVIGRATRGLAMTPVKVESYSQFVEMFGPTVPGNGGGDIYKLSVSDVWNICRKSVPERKCSTPHIRTLTW
mgnify:CR=1 FL=1